MTDADHTPGGISIHAVDISRGVPAEGLRVQLLRLDGCSEIEVAKGECNESGLLVHPIAKGIGAERGLYILRFDVGSYFRAADVNISNPGFLETAEFHFGVDRIEEHFHLPIKFTPWGYSLFRGGA
ncbi:hydroxyisourate hydrolase [Leisingera sp. S232]|uniref:hydroxyisourate hydrolase n=1 Tax=Leisingera sp. S232 TaxID=3415132 RepID=UPI003C7B645B